MENVWSMKAGLLLGFLVTLIGLAMMPSRVFPGDPYTWKQEGISLIERHSLSVEPELAHQHGEPGQYFTANKRSGLFYSKFGVMSGLLSVPPLLFELARTGQLPAWESPPRRFYFGVYAALLAGLVALLLFRLCCHYTRVTFAAFAFALIACTCTFLFYYSRNSNSEYYQLLFYLCFFERFAAWRASEFRNRDACSLAWLALTALVLTKITHLLLVPGFLLVIGWALWRRRAVREFFWAGLLPLAGLLSAQAMVSFVKFGSVIGTGYDGWDVDALRHDVAPLEMVRNLFFTRQWGVFAHFPLLLLALPFARSFARRFPLDAALALGAFAVTFAVVGSMHIWRGEWGYGPRYFLIFLPVLALPALSAFESRRLLVWAGLAVPLAIAATLQFQLARLDSFFFYWVRPNLQVVRSEELKEFWNAENFGVVAWQAWSGRNHVDEISWMKLLRADFGEERYEPWRGRVETWLGRTNLYWWSEPEPPSGGPGSR